MLRVFASLIVWLWTVVASAATLSTPPTAAIATAHPLATEAAGAILKQGGNAFDAAVAAAATLAVVEPFGSGLGGGGFFLLHRARDGHEVMVDARERAPLAARRDMYLDAEGNPIPRASLDGPLAAAVPGVPAALAHLAAKYGRLPLETALAPAIRHAREGFAVSAHYRRMAGLRRSALLASEGSLNLFLDHGEPPEAGFVLRQPELAAALERLAARGHDGFYRGETARRLVEGVRAAGGIWTLEDLDRYRVIERVPVRANYRGMRLVTAALPSSGGVLLERMLATLADGNEARGAVQGCTGCAFDRSRGTDRTAAIIEAMREGYRLRMTLGDPDPGKDAAAANTTHFSILDREGNRVAATLSLNLPFGSGFTAPGTGVLLNNQMDDFAIKPATPNVYGLTGGEANAIAPGKRPLSSMTPTFLETGDAVAILGTPGGARIVSMVLLATLDFAGGERDPARLVARPRFHHQDSPARLDHEPGAFSEAGRRALIAAGYELREIAEGYGNMQAVVWEKRAGRVRAAADPRGEGAVVD
jgi:gamma-glutamyltranspeptidase/glutathione hydrolase